ncbi:MAG: coproporphyrinogen-III oxidase family protein [Gemmatimonadota bacterium]
MSLPAHLYLHVPFCLRGCPYCDYAVSVDDPPSLEGWLSAVRGELDLRGGPETLSNPLRTVHVGGGTPSTLGEALPLGILALLGAKRLDGLDEWTIEANPEDLDAPLLARWKETGVTRVNVGLQSLHPAALDFLGRGHEAGRGEVALQAIAKGGFRSWGVDLLYGLPPDVERRPRVSLERVLRAAPPHVSLYELVAEAGTPLGRAVARGAVRLADDDLRADQYLELGGLLEVEGYEAYEMTAFARPGHESRHGRAVLLGESFVGLGPSANSRIGGRVLQNARNWQGYERSVARGIGIGRARGWDARAGVEIVAEGELTLVRLHDRLRLREGLPLEGLTAAGRELGRRWTALGWAHPDPERLRLTPAGWLRLDSLAIELGRVETEGAEKVLDRNGMEDG